MSDLTAFLLARLDEDESDANHAAQGDPDWLYADHYGAMRIESSDGTNITHDSEGLSDSVQSFAGPHIARHDPARVLADVQAKRAIVAMFDAADDDDYTALHAAVGHLADVYSDHPDYVEAWRP